MKHLNIKVHGRVQGVFFRHATRNLASYLGLRGFVRNEADGALYIEAEGEEAKLNELLAWSKYGPPTAEVRKIDFEFSEKLKNYEDFSIA